MDAASSPDRAGLTALAALRALFPAAGASVEERSRWVARTYLLFAAALTPWVVYLAVVLPDRNLDRHYNLAWVGFDCLLIVAMARTAWLAYHRRPELELPAIAAATLLVVDAWFDITTSASGRALTEALLLAVFVELPTAALSITVARRANARLAIAGRQVEDQVRE